MMDATPLLRGYAAWRLRRLARQDAAATQRATLRSLLTKGAKTRFGVAHGFAGLHDVVAYQARVKPRAWEAFWTEWWQAGFPLLRGATWPDDIPCVALSSGTSGGPTKRIPVSAAMLRSNRWAALETLCWHVAAHPRSRVLAGRNFILGGSTALREVAPGVAPGVVEGDLSGIAARDIPFWARGRSWPPDDIALLGDWERKMARLVAETPRETITSLSGTPSWLLLFLDMLADANPRLPRRLSALFPNLELVVHGGVGFAPYAGRFAQWLEGGSVALREVYAASEGFFAVADRGPGEGLRLILDNGIFYEFVSPAQVADPNAPRRWIGDAETGVDYALVVTTNAGLWSYIVGDTVVLTDRNPPRVRVSGRTAWMLSVFGEHVIGSELDAAVVRAAGALGVAVSEYAVGAVFPDAASGKGGHWFLVEASGTPDAQHFAAVLDTTLSALNEDYAAHRGGGFGMHAPRVTFVPPGSFTAWMRTRGKLGGQNKVPRVILDPALLESLAAYAANA
jgi:GH3 auxin-responsive promoter